MNRSFRTERFNNNYHGESISDVFKSMFDSASKKLASESATKIAKSAIESGVKAAAEPVGKKSGEFLANKIFNSSDKDKKIEPIIEEPKIVSNKGVIIEKELKKIYNNKINDIDKKDHINSNISNKFDELL